MCEIIKKWRRFSNVILLFGNSNDEVREGRKRVLSVWTILNEVKKMDVIIEILTSLVNQ